jgi:hypothetical protein
MATATLRDLYEAELLADLEASAAGRVVDAVF